MVCSILKKGAWTQEEDNLLRKCIEIYGEGKWHQVPLRAGLNRCRKSCRLRWLNYLKPNIKRGEFAADEVDLMIRLHKLLGNRWSLIAGRLPGRTSNDVKNYWNTHIQKKIFPNKKKVSHETTEIVKPIAIRPRPRIFRKVSPWLREKVSTHTESVKLKDNIENPSPALQLHSLENDNKCWGSLLDGEKDNGRSTCSARELEDEPIRNLWLEEIASPEEVGDTTVEKGNNRWSDISFEADNIWNILSPI